MQNGRPLEYASRNLKPNEKNWAQIEKEMLSVVFALEKFDQYTFGRTVIIHNDHKPLATILKKPLSHAPRRIQALMMRLYRYDIDFRWIPGDSLVIADTLSRASLIDSEEEHIMAIDIFSGIPDQRIKEIQEATAKDSTMQELLQHIQNGWAEKKHSLPEIIRP